MAAAGTSTSPATAAARTGMSIAPYRDPQGRVHIGLAEDEVAYEITPAIDGQRKLIVASGGPDGHDYVVASILLKAMGYDRFFTEKAKSLFTESKMRVRGNGVFIRRSAILQHADVPAPVRVQLEAFPALLAASVAVSSTSESLKAMIARAKVSFAKPEDLSITTISRGSLQTAFLRTKNSHEELLTKLEADNSISVISIKGLLAPGSSDINNPYGFSNVLQNVITKRFGPNTADGSFIETRWSAWKSGGREWQEGDKENIGYKQQLSFPASITATAAQYIFSTFAPEALPLLEKLLGIEAISYHVYQPLTVAERAPLVETLQADLRQLAINTHTPIVSDSNAFDDLPILRLRQGEDFRENKFFTSMYEVLDGARDDPFVKDSAGIYSTLRLPKLGGEEGAPMQWGYYVSGKEHTGMPHLGCHLCETHTAIGRQWLSTHMRQQHGGSDALHDWARASECWDIIMINLDSLDMQTVKRWKTDTTDEFTFGKEGDNIIFFVHNHEYGKYQCVDALHDVLRDTRAPASMRDAAETIIYLYCVLTHLLESTILTKHVAEGTGALTTKSVAQLIRSYHASSPLVKQADFPKGLLIAMQLVCRSASTNVTVKDHAYFAMGQKWQDRSGQAVGDAIWPLGFRTLRLQDFPYLRKTGIVIRSDKQYELILVFRRTRGGGWVLILAIIVAFGTWAMARGIAMLERYLQNGDIRRKVIANDLGIPFKEVSSSSILLNGVPADGPGIPETTEVIKGWKEKGGERIHFVDYRPIFESNGTHQGRTYILSASGWDGWLADALAIVNTLGHWTDGIIVFHIDHRVASGIINYQSTGTQQTVWIEVPRLCQYIRERQAEARTKQLERQKLFCIHPAETQSLDDEIGVIKATLVSAVTLNDDQRFLYEEVLRNMSIEVDNRRYARSARNTRGASVGTQYGGEALDVEDELDFEEDVQRYPEA